MRSVKVVDTDTRVAARYLAAIMLAVLLYIFVGGCAGPAMQGEASSSAGNEQSAKIMLIGEYHGVDWIYAKEFEKLNELYSSRGMRHLFLETPYYTAKLLNIWMESDNDEILDSIYADWDGTFDHNIDKYEFFRKIKSECPETVFHGVDVGHQYFSIGEHYLKYLAGSGQGVEEQRLAEEAIEQGKRYYDGFGTEAQANEYREEMLVQNFMREYSKLNDELVMGIFGGYHTDFRSDIKSDLFTEYPCMAKRLRGEYGDVIWFENFG